MIFESPDGGKTVYSRQPGSTVKQLHYESEEVKSMRDKLLEDKMWGEIRRLAQTDPTMKDLADKMIMTYHLLKDGK